MKTLCKKVLAVFIVLMLLPLLFGCGVGETHMPDPDQIVPKKDVLIENLEADGYDITELHTIEGSELAINRIKAQKGDRFIDIVYGLSAQDAEKIFAVYENLYAENYYILAINGNYVHCVSDKKTFKKAGFTTTANVGTQYINN